MNVYSVEPDDLIGEAGLTGLRAVCEPIVGQLVARFDLAGKTLMSVGAGSAHEESALLRGGMRRALLFDVDEHGTLEPTLRRIDRPGRTDAPFVYFVGDFAEALRRGVGVEPVDVLYFSGFTPDERRRGEIAERHRQRIRDSRSAGDGRRSLLDRVRALVVRKPSRAADPDWPAGVSPVHDAVLGAIDRHLARGGLFILQSYSSGVDVLRNPRYVSAWARVLRRRRVTLIETYYFRAAPAVTLWVGVKRGGRGGAPADLTARPPLTRFHARAELDDCSIARLGAGDVTP